MDWCDDLSGPRSPPINWHLPCIPSGRPKLTCVQLLNMCETRRIAVHSCTLTHYQCAIMIVVVNNSGC
eukprot:2853876-Alexandrium_andersonii.AAC.1